MLDSLREIISTGGQVDRTFVMSFSYTWLYGYVNIMFS